MTETQRIKKVVEWLIFKGKVKSRRDLAENMGYTESSVSQILNGKVPLSDKFIKKLSIMDSVINQDWLFTGEGEMLNTHIQTDSLSGADNKSVSMPIDFLLSMLNRQEQQLLSQQNAIAVKDGIIESQQRTIEALSLKTPAIADDAKIAGAGS
jgi:transcriptional regulator with XRE-family HTH domain